MRINFVDWQREAECSIKYQWKLMVIEGFGYWVLLNNVTLKSIIMI